MAVDTGLADAVVLITGANTGIGAATARAFGAQGATVVLHYLAGLAHPPDPSVRLEHLAPGRGAAEEVAGSVSAAGGRAVLLEADLAEPGAPARVLEEAEAMVGPVDVLVNNAAHCESPDTVLAATAGGFDRHFQVNVRAAALLLMELADRRRRAGRTGGRVINVSTDSARAFPTQVAYGASKAALEALTRSAAFELGPLGITVNAVAPGPVQTGWMTSELEERVVASIPLGRVGTPEDVADAVVFLASRQASWITGQVLRVAGGHVL